MDYTTKSCREFVTVLASSEPAPGGGGAAALVAARGTALGALPCKGCAPGAGTAEHGTQPLPDLGRGPVKKVQADAQRQHQHDEVRGGAAAAQQQAAAQHDTREQQKREPIRAEKTVGRNDPCPCGSGKKYKNCHGKNA